ncbi:MAG: thioredoxin family protein [Victivallaceae bacterium]|nr:thioredoxin family protein [Victivallaceae bacterium]
MKKIVMIGMGIAAALAWNSVSAAPVAAKNDAKSVKKADSVATFHWMENYDAALAAAKKENKLILAVFSGSDWCPPCQMVARKVFSNKIFQDYVAKNFVALEVDFPRRKAQSVELQRQNNMLAKKFEVSAFPTIMILRPDGTKLDSKKGVMVGAKIIEPRAFVVWMEANHNIYNRQIRDGKKK